MQLNRRNTPFAILPYELKSTTAVTSKSPTCYHSVTDFGLCLCPSSVTQGPTRIAFGRCHRLQIPRRGLQWDQSNQKSGVIGCAVTAAAVLLCPEVSRADEGGASFWLPGSVCESRCRAADTGLGTQRQLLPFQRRRGRQRRCGERNPDRQNSCDREGRSESEPERASRSGHARAILYFRDAGSWRTAVRKHVQPVRPKRQQSSPER